MATNRFPPRASIDIQFSGFPLGLIRRLSQGTGLSSSQVVDHAMDVTDALYKVLDRKEIHVYPSALPIGRYLKGMSHLTYVADAPPEYVVFDYHRELSEDDMLNHQRNWIKCEAQNWQDYAEKTLSPYATLHRLYARGGRLVLHGPFFLKLQQEVDLAKHFRPSLEIGRG